MEKYGTFEKMMSMGVTDHLSEKTRGKKMEERELKKHIQEKKMNFLSDRDATASYHKEQKWLKLLAQGGWRSWNIRKIPLARKILYGRGADLSGRPQQMEYNLVACITLACRAVITAGVDPFEAYRISDIYLQQLSECTELKDMMWVAGTVMGEFNELAKAANPENREASIDVENAKTYICRHLQEKLTMQEVCRAVECQQRISVEEISGIRDNFPGVCHGGAAEAVGQSAGADGGAGQRDLGLFFFRVPQLFLQLFSQAVSDDAVGISETPQISM